MTANGELPDFATETKPGGTVSRRSPWLIQTSSSPGRPASSGGSADRWIGGRAVLALVPGTTLPPSCWARAASRSRCRAPAVRNRTPIAAPAARPRHRRCSGRRRARFRAHPARNALRSGVEGEEFAVGVELANAPRDEHAELRAEIEHHDRLVALCGVGGCGMDAFGRRGDSIF